MSAYIKSWNELSAVKAELAERDWFYGTSGNLSIKVRHDPLTFLVTASGKDKRKQTDEDFLLVDGNGAAVEETHLKPSAETLIHAGIYNKTNATCSLHVHTVANNVISELYGDEGKVVFQGQELIKAFGLWEEDAILEIPIVENYADIPKLTDVMLEHIHEDAGVVLIRNHGITSWGTSAFEAKKLLEASEFLFQYHLTLLQLKR